MDYEKAYNDARARLELVVRTGMKLDPAYIFPELAESERIRKGIVATIEQCSDILDPKNQKQMLAWLEMQKPVEWSEEDEGILKSIISRLEALAVYETQYLAKACLEREITFLKSLHPEFKQEWTEEEKQKLNRIYSIIGWAMDEHAFNSCKKLIGDKKGVELQDFLRAIAKPEQQSHWKPCEEQIHAIVEALKYLPNNKDEWRVLNTLVDVFRKLM